MKKKNFEKEYLHTNNPVRFIGDFVSLATNKYTLIQNHNVETCKSTHAGITPEETQIPIITIHR